MQEVEGSDLELLLLCVFRGGLGLAPNYPFRNPFESSLSPKQAWETMGTQALGMEFGELLCDHELTISISDSIFISIKCRGE